MSNPRPYTFSGLPRLTRQQVALHESVQRHLSARIADPQALQALAATLARELRVACTLGHPSLRTLARAEALAAAPAVGSFAVVGAGAEDAQLVLDIDPSLSAWCVERLLGGADEQPQAARVARAPTDLEAGVLSYLLLQVLHFFAAMPAAEAQPLVLRRVLGTSEALDEALGDEGLFVQVSLRVQLGAVAGYARLLLPERLVTTRFGAPLADDHASLQMQAHMRRRLQALPELHLTGQVIGAHLDLSQDDLDHLEVGDIIVLEGHALALGPDGIAGAVRVAMGQGRHGHLEARLFAEAGEARLEITAITVQNEPPGADMADDAPNDADNLPETQGLLREVDASVAVELGRIRLNTAQIVRLRQGQVLNLARGANDPVSLVVGGKLFAKGELIEVDGELGVRITQLTGDA